VFIPLRTEVDSQRSPVVTPLLIVANGLALVAVLLGDRMGWLEAGRVLRLVALQCSDFHWWQPLTYQFMHDLQSIWHVLFNMLFLWVFGCAVESRLGRPGFLLFYLAGGVVAGLAHMLASPSPVIGASGAVAACGGAFLALFPRAQVKVLFVFLLIGIVQVPALLFIGVYVAYNVAMQLSATLGGGGDRVAYAAHLGGYVYGFAICFALLAARLLPRRDVDVWYLFTQARRRRAMRQAAAEAQRGGRVWRSDPGAGSAPRATADASPRTAASPIGDAVRPPPPPPPNLQQASDEDPRVRRLRLEIDASFTRLDVAGATEAFRRLLAIAPSALLPEQRQLDVANQLLADGHDELAASTYERFLAAYPRGDRADEVRLLLASIWTRRIPQPAKARPLLESLLPRLRNAGHAALAEQLLRELPA